jgi:hydrogenase maturation protease
MNPDSKAVLILTWGNPSRGDDALGPLCHNKLTQLRWKHVELVTDFQLQIEHCTDLENRKLVIFIDASMSATTPYEFREISPHKDQSYSSHAVSPQSLMDICQSVNSTPLPECWLMEIRGYQFELGEPLSSRAGENLVAAQQAITDFIRNFIPE